MGYALAAELGLRLVAAERALDRAFASGDPTAEELERLTGESAVIEGRLRAVHLRVHLETRDLLTETQIREYQRRRGYGGHHGPGDSVPLP